MPGEPGRNQGDSGRAVEAVHTQAASAKLCDVVCWSYVLVRHQEKLSGNVASDKNVAARMLYQLSNHGCKLNECATREIAREVVDNFSELHHSACTADFTQAGNIRGFADVSYRQCEVCWSCNATSMQSVTLAAGSGNNPWFELLVQREGHPLETAASWQEDGRERGRIQRVCSEQGQLAEAWRLQIQTVLRRVKFIADTFQGIHTIG